MEQRIIVAVYGLILNTKNHLLVTNEVNRSGWKLPGGWANFGETIEKSARREIAEELGIEVKLEAAMGVWQHLGENDHRIRFFVVGRTLADNYKPDGKEVLSIDSVPLDDMRLRNPNSFFKDYFYEPVQEYLAGKVYPLAELRRITYSS